MEEQFLVGFYLHTSDSSYLWLNSNELKDTKLAGIYKQPIYGELPELLFYYALSGGIWQPYDKLSILGLHPSLGGYAGLSYNRMIYNLGLDFRFGNSPNEFKVLYKDSLFTTKDFTGINVSLEAGRKLIKWRRHEFDLLGGIDVEVINVVTIKNESDNSNSDESKNITSPSVHLGAAYRYYLKNDRYIGLSSRYHLINFDNKGGTNLRGNALTITFEYGFGANPWLHHKYTYLEQRLPASR